MHCRHQTTGSRPSAFVAIPLLILVLLAFAAAVFAAAPSVTAVPPPVRATAEGAEPAAPPPPVFPFDSHVLVLMYHHLDPVVDTSSTISVDLFRAQMQYLKSEGYNVISMQAFESFMEGSRKLPEKAVLITFDDGYESLYTYAFPILKEFGFSATCFVIVGHTGIVAPGGRLKHLSWGEMDTLQKSGLITFGSHSYDSHMYIPAEGGPARPALAVRRYNPTTGLTETEEAYERRVFDDLLLSRKTLEEHLHTTIDTMAFPYGVSTPEGREMAQRAGFRFMFGVKAGMVSEHSSWGELDRVNAGSEKLTVAALAEAIGAAVFNSLTTWYRARG